MWKLTLTLGASLLVALFGAALGYAESEQNRTYFISPKDGDTFSGPIMVRFGLQGYGVAPAGVDKEKTGHHHLLIDVDQMPPLDKPLPKDDKYRHFGGGQTEASLILPKGQHTLQLILGNKDHVPVGKMFVSEKITINVE